MSLLGVQEVQEELRACEKCPRLLARMKTLNRTPEAAMGRGSASAPILLFGAGPGEDDLIHGSTPAAPWKGPAGQRLIQMLAHSAYKAKLVSPELHQVFSTRPGKGSTREDLRAYWRDLWDVFEGGCFFSNTTHCLPPHGEVPTAREAASCSPWAARITYAVDPLLIFALGKGPASALLGRKVDMPAATEKGKLYTIAVASPVTGRPIPYAMIVLPSIGLLLQTNDQAGMEKGKGVHALWRDQAAWGMSLVDETLKLAYGAGFWDYKKPQPL